MVVEEGSDVKSLARECSIFSSRSLSAPDIRDEARMLGSGNRRERAQGAA